MRMIAVCMGFLLLAVPPLGARGQGDRPPFCEDFDTLAPPALPAGWSSTRARNPQQDDVVSTSSLPRSAPNALILTNSTVAQGFVGPLFSLAQRGAGELHFALRRSATFLARLTLQASTDGGETFPLSVGSEILPETDSHYTDFHIPLPAILNGENRIRLRWSTTPTGTGSTGTLRVDDVAVTATELVDCAAGPVTCASGRLQEGERIRISLRVTNAGLLPLDRWRVSFGWRAPGDAEPAWDPGSGMTVNEPLGGGDSTFVPSEIALPAPGVWTLCAIVRAEEDRNPLNDTSLTLLRIGARAGRVLFNEIMYSPSPGEPEWVELVNTLPSPLSLRGWTIGDETDPEGKPLAPAFAVMSPLGFAVVAEDTARFRALHPDFPPDTPLLAGLPTLNNAGDSLLLHDPAGNATDIVRYSPLWQHPALVAPAGRSLERVALAVASSDPRNWGSCVDPSGGTPGLPNSIALRVNPSRAGLQALPNPFSPDDDGVDDRTAIHYRNPAGSGTMTVRIFDVRGRQVRCVANNEPCGGEGVVIWDGMDETRRRVRIGIYVILLEIVPAGEEPLQAAKGSVVVAGRL